MARLIALLIAALTPLTAQAIKYELRFPNAVHHEAEVRATFAGVGPNPLEVVMSRSSPGRYALHEFAKNVYNVRAVDGAGRPLTIVRPTPYQWNVGGNVAGNVAGNIAGNGGTVVFSYTLFGDALDGTYNAIDSTHAHLNPPATFVWARGLENRPVQVHFDAPAGAKWEVATQLVPVDGWWTESSRDMLIDSPIEFGPYATREWDSLGKHFVLSLHSSGTDAAVSEYARLCEAIALEEAGVFGGFPAYDHGRYTFIVDYLPYASGDGMEHRNSTMITENATPGRKSFADLVGSAAHEFFHSWNVERMRPRTLEPFDLERANMSGELWFAEGFTNYYGHLAMERSGIGTLDQFAGDLSLAVNSTLTSPGRDVFDVTDMSRMAPFVDRAGNSDPTNQANAFITYYYYGEALALGIDLSIRQQFPGKSLDDWMRAMWREHSDVQAPYTLEDLERTLGEATGNAAFAQEIFRRYIYDRNAMDYATLLDRAGLILRKASPGEVWLGASRTNLSKQGLSITAATLRGSPAYAAGLDRGDRITNVDGKDIKEQKDWAKVLKSHQPGERSTLRVSGRSGERTVELTWQESPALEIVTFEKAKRDVTPEIRDFRAAWLSSKAIAPLPKLR